MYLNFNERLIKMILLKITALRVLYICFCRIFTAHAHSSLNMCKLVELFIEISSYPNVSRHYLFNYNPFSTSTVVNIFFIDRLVRTVLLHLQLTSSNYVQIGTYGISLLHLSRRELSLYRAIVYHLNVDHKRSL